ncbi:O-succinylbenzoic acid--CoA ligase [Mariniphaga anaerophila]|uniref:O-succinylbenzoic acid--CoA ligase n=1 Tax=Mariniphaga anaerophila TaxID=1484053 RepID=A0A1M5CTJ8_9BACT|nr:AMP-binding protein [Mariniphaga anaerophila]SHF58049.1 O-succinylbenzoic acid--CoA ligase [Mariniphaga anaerophila]
MNLFPSHIILNGNSVAVSEFVEKEQQTESERQLAVFLKTWYAPEDFVEVKTSGSTGIPKVIRLKKEFVAASAQRTIRFFHLKEGHRILHCLPLKYIAGKLMVVRALLGNLDLCMVEPTTDFAFLQNNKFRFAAMVPNQVSKILNTEPGENSWIRNIEQLLIGGSSVPQQVEKQLQNVSAACYSSYAMTETATHIALRKINGPDADSFYHCLNDINVQISAKECLRISMPGLSTQYIETTDLAEVKDEKTFRILGRSDNVIISGGIKFSPEELEKKLEPFIKQPFLVSSKPHNSLGQQLVLVIEGTEDKTLVEQLMCICRQELEKYEQPRQIVFIAEIPRTPTGKISRKEILF